MHPCMGIVTWMYRRVVTITSRRLQQATIVERRVPVEGTASSGHLCLVVTRGRYGKRRLATQGDDRPWHQRLPPYSTTGAATMTGCSARHGRQKVGSFGW